MINYNNNLSRGLVAVYAIINKNGSMVNLLNSTDVLTAVNSGTWSQSGVFGSQLDCSQANDSGAWNTSPPSSMKPAKQVSIFWQGTPFSGATQNSQYAGMTYTNSDTNPYIGYNLQDDAVHSGYSFTWNDDGTFDFLNTPTNVGYANGIERQLLFTIQSGGQFSYENGILMASRASTFTNITYGANAQFGIGIYQNGIGRNSKAKCSLCYVWNRVVTAPEALQLYTNPLQIFLQSFRFKKFGR